MEQNSRLLFYYTDEERKAELVLPPSGHQCVVGVLEKVRKGASLCFAADSVGCGGGRRYLGFAEESMSNFQYFLSYGIPGKLEGERYKKFPELVTEIMERSPKFKAPERFIVFKRWDRLANGNNPVATIFFASPDVLSGLYALANFDEGEPNGVFSPFAAGCGSIVCILISNRAQNGQGASSGCSMYHPGPVCLRKHSPWPYR
jgi:uncharacterized protein (DUF169 family)